MNTNNPVCKLSSKDWNNSVYNNERCLLPSSRKEGFRVVHFQSNQKTSVETKPFALTTFSVYGVLFYLGLAYTSQKVKVYTRMDVGTKETYMVVKIDFSASLKGIHKLNTHYVLFTQFKKESLLYAELK